VAASVSSSTDISQIDIWLSAPDTARDDSSDGCHSIEVIGAVWYRK